ncbi:MAG: GroES family chaperonin [Actinomycetota bacterium]|jgi:chaperonin GroES
MAARTPKLRSVPEGEPTEADPGQAASQPDTSEKIRLTADRILIRVPDETERRSKAGLVIPATAAPHMKRCEWAEVVLIGPETKNVKPGDRILFLPQTGLEVDVRGETFLLLRERDVQAIESDRDDPHGGQYL